GQRADGPRDAVVGEALEKLRGPATPDLDLGERCEVEDRRLLAAGRVLDPDSRRPQAAGPAVGAQRLVASRSVRLEPVHAHPARLLADCSAQLRQPGIDGRPGKRTPGAWREPGGLAGGVGRIDLAR